MIKANAAKINVWSTNAETNVTNDLSAEALLQFSDDVDLRHLFQFVM